jgi:hypothetical protein
MRCEVNPKEKEMRKPNRSWMAVAAAALLLGTLAGAVWARPNQGPQAADITRKITLAAADFIPSMAGDWFNSGDYLYCNGICAFTAPVVFPCLQSVTVERIRLHVDDASDSWGVTAQLYRAKPPKGTQDLLANVSSPQGTSGGLQTYTSNAINKVVWPSQRAYVGLVLWDSNIKVYGVTVEYHRN